MCGSLGLTSTFKREPAARRVASRQLSDAVPSGAIMALKPRPQSLCGFLSNNWACYEHWSQLCRTLPMGPLSSRIYHQPGLESLRVVLYSNRLFWLHSFNPSFTSFTAVRPALSLGSPLLGPCSFFFYLLQLFTPKTFYTLISSWQRFPRLLDWYHMCVFILIHQYIDNNTDACINLYIYICTCLRVCMCTVRHVCTHTQRHNTFI